MKIILALDTVVHIRDYPENARLVPNQPFNGWCSVYFEDASGGHSDWINMGYMIAAVHGEGK